jgi:hypothetical protein
MPLFSKKRQLATADFCREFLTKQLFDTVIGDVDVNRAYHERVFNSVVQADPGSANVPFDDFLHELTLLRIELFGLAIAHEKHNEAHWRTELSSTKSLLHNAHLETYWDEMLPYNHAVADSAAGVRGGERIQAARTTFINQLRHGKYEDWTAAGIDPDIAGRAASRLDSERAWKQKLCIVYLLRTFAEQLHYNYNDDARFNQLAAVFSGYYVGARQSIQEVDMKL